ncbi:hypothetical protein F4859DRAFT_416493 [Xylaria cf. heliscus]|nr:hypothetical protein F4859DRAFT_416493 [Xylaria cf. heliscus]
MNSANQDTSIYKDDHKIIQKGSIYEGRIDLKTGSTLGQGNSVTDNSQRSICQEGSTFRSNVTGHESQIKQGNSVNGVSN